MNEENKLNDIYQKFLSQKTTINDFRNRTIEYGSEYKLKREKLRKEIEKDENKYNEENLKKLKIELDKLINLLIDKKETLKGLNQKLLVILNNTSLSYDLISTSIAAEIYDLNKKQDSMLNGPYIISGLENFTHFMAGNTAIVVPNDTRNSSDFSIVLNDNEINRPAILTASQKGKLIYIRLKEYMKRNNTQSFLVISKIFLK